MLIGRQEILENLKRKIDSDTNGYSYDIYDGGLWKDAKYKDGSAFFSDKQNIGGLINVDWFQPFTNSEHSIGVIYMVLLNLSRNIRFQLENVIIVGIIPGPREPKLTINTFLQPLVSDLLKFWKGVFLNEDGQEVMYRFMLLGSFSDLPATRKCCGFMSYNALHSMILL